MFTSSINLNYKPLKINFMITFKPTAKQLFVYLLLQHTLLKIQSTESLYGHLEFKPHKQVS